MAQEKKAAPDWERIEADYRAGIFSLREIAASNPGVSHQAIAKRAKVAGWVRDLSAKIHAKADSLVDRQAVDTSVDGKAAVNERQIIEVNAARIAQVRGEHRADISRMRRLVLDLLGELEAVTGNLDLFEQLGEILRSEDDKGQDKRNDVYVRAISTASRIDGLKKLADAMKVLVSLERESYGLVSNGSGEESEQVKQPFNDAELIARARRIVGRRSGGSSATDSPGVQEQSS